MTFRGILLPDLQPLVEGDVPALDPLATRARVDQSPGSVEIELLVEDEARLPVARKAAEAAQEMGQKARASGADGDTVYEAVRRTLSAYGIEVDQ